MRPLSNAYPSSYYLVDRGERIVNGKPRRVCYVETLGKAGDLRILSKVRFAHKSDMSDRMQICCYSALKEMVLATQLKHPEEAAARELLAVRLVEQQLTQKRGPAKTPFNGPYGLAGFSSML